MDNSAPLFSILNKPISEKVDLLIGKPIESLGITAADILHGVVSLIFDYAVLEPTFCPMFAQLCSDLKRKLDPFPFPAEEPAGKQITLTVRRVLMHTCQEAFEGLYKLKKEKRQKINAKERSTLKHRALVSIRLVGELFKLKMVPGLLVHDILQELLGPESKICLWEKVEAKCLFLHIIGKQLDENPGSRRANDIYFNGLKELSTNPQLAARIRFMVREILDLRLNNWIPWREEEKAKIYNELHNEEKNRRHGHPGSTSNIPGSEPPPPMFRKKPLANQRFPPPRIVSFTIAKYNALMHACGGFTPLRSEEYFWFPLDYQVAIRTQSKSAVQAATHSYADEIKRMTISLLNEYFSVLILDDVLQFVKDVKSPNDYPEFVKEAIFLFLDRSPPCVEPMAKLLDYLLLNKILRKNDLRKGCRNYALLLQEIEIDLSLAPNDFGEIMGYLVLSGGIDFKIVREVIDEMIQHCYFRQVHYVFDGVMRIVGSSSSGNVILIAQADDVAACKSHFIHFS